jgi:hypothetical protein
MVKRKSGAIDIGMFLKKLHISAHLRLNFISKLNRRISKM